MNHQLFENWLLSEEPLSPQQSAELREHLHTCQSCSRLQASWKGVEQLIREAPQIGPAAGFSARWQIRLEEQRRMLQRRQSLLILSIIGSPALVLFLVLGYNMLVQLRSPGQLLALWAYRMLLALNYVDAASDFLTAFGTTFLNTVSGPVWLFILGGISVLTVLWVVLYKQLTSPQRIQI
jgi:hypothetical protein